MNICVQVASNVAGCIMQFTTKGGERDIRILSKYGAYTFKCCDKGVDSFALERVAY